MEASRRIIIAGGFALAATGAHAAAPAQVACRRMADGSVELSWSGATADVRLATSPDGPFTTRLAKGAKGQWRGASPISPRPYFQLVGAAGVNETAERLLPLQGGRNFRDLGGYRTADGRMVRWGQLYRSGSMATLTSADYAYLRSLGISVICDFRTTAERTKEPTQWTGPGTPKMFSRDYAQTSDDFIRTLLAEGPTAEKVRAHMISIYKTMPYEHADSYRTMFAELVAGRTPLAFNCSGGKDRTGIGAALLLTTLGVPRAQVLEDYALSEQIMDFETIARNSAVAGGPPPAGFETISRLSPEVRAPMIRSDPAYLQSAFTAIETREGSIANFMARRVGVSAANVQTLRARLLKRT